MKKRVKPRRVIHGGKVIGPGGPRDDKIPVQFAHGGRGMVSNGEYISPADTTKKFLPLLEAMRMASHDFSGAKKGYADGGLLDLAARGMKGRQQQLENAINQGSGVQAPAVAKPADEDPDYNSPARVKARERLKAMGIPGYADGGTVQTDMNPVLGWIANKLMGGSYGQAMSKGTGEAPPTYVPEPRQQSPELTVGGSAATPDDVLRARINARMQRGYADGGMTMPLYSSGNYYTDIGSSAPGLQQLGTLSPAFQQNSGRDMYGNSTSLTNRLNTAADNLRQEREGSPSILPSPTGYSQNTVTAQQPSVTSTPAATQPKPLEGYDRNVAMGEHRYADGGYTGTYLGMRRHEDQSNPNLGAISEDPALRAIGNWLGDSASAVRASASDLADRIGSMGTGSRVRQATRQQATSDVPGVEMIPAAPALRRASPFVTPRVRPDANLEGYPAQSILPAPGQRAGEQPLTIDVGRQQPLTIDVGRRQTSFDNRSALPYIGKTGPSMTPEEAKAASQDYIGRHLQAANIYQSMREPPSYPGDQVNIPHSSWADEMQARNRRVELSTLKPDEQKLMLELWQAQDDAAAKREALGQQAEQFDKQQLQQQYLAGQKFGLDALGNLNEQQKLAMQAPGLRTENQLRQFEVMRQQQLQNLYGDLAKAQTPDEQQRITAQILAHLGKSPEPLYEIAKLGGAQTLEGKEPDVGYRINKQTGEITPIGDGAGKANPYAEAVAIIARDPAKKAEVNKRLQAAGYQQIP